MTTVDPGLIEDVIPQEFYPVKVLPNSKVVGLFGGKGSGKSASMAWYMEAARRTGRKVFYFPEKYRFHKGTALTYEQLVTLAELDPEDTDSYMSELNGALIGIDEFQIIFSKYRSSTLANRAVGSFMQQVRKRGCILIFTSNDPGGIDEAAETQTDFHAFCKYVEDKRCKQHKYHLRDCRDTIWLKYVDTHGQLPRDPRQHDGRRRWQKRIFPAIRTAVLYNTFAAISSQEVAQMDGASVMRAYQAARSGINHEDLLRFFRVFIIPWLVEEKGAAVLLPGVFIDSVLSEINADNFDPEELYEAGLSTIKLPLEMSTKQLGEVLTELGLEKKRGSGGYRYKLPESGDLEDWKSGILQA